MGIDDERAKIRRNLVTFCAALLVCFYLDISMYELFVQFGLGKLQTKVSPGKLVLVSFAIFVYLFLRWVTGAEQKKLFEEVVSSFKLRGGVLIGSWVFDMAKKRNFGTDLDFSNETSRKSFEEWWQKHSSREDSPGALNISPRSSSAYQFEAQWQLNFYFHKPNEDSTKLLYIDMKFSVPFWHRMRIRFQSLQHVMWQSDFWEWTPPAIFSFITLLVLIYKAIMSVFFPSHPIGVLYCA